MWRVRTAAAVLAWTVALAAPAQRPTWTLLSSANGDLPVPLPGNQQTASQTADLDGDGIDDIVIADRTQAPAVTWLRRGADGWTRHVIEAERLPPEAGGDHADFDGDGNLDIWCGEMHTPGHGDDATAWLLYGDGRGGFERTVAHRALGYHEARPGDLDGDGDVDVLIKPYTAGAPLVAVLRNDR